MSKFEEIFIAAMVILIMGANLIYQQSKINKMETMVSLLSEHIDRNSKTQLLLNDECALAMSNEVGISDHLIEIADMIKNHMADTSIHQKVITVPGGWNLDPMPMFQNTNNYYTIPMYDKTGAVQQLIIPQYQGNIIGVYN